MLSFVKLLSINQYIIVMWGNTSWISPAEIEVSYLRFTDYNSTGCLLLNL